MESIDKLKVNRAGYFRLGIGNFSRHFMGQFLYFLYKKIHTIRGIFCDEKLKTDHSYDLKQGVNIIPKGEKTDWWLGPQVKARSKDGLGYNHIQGTEGFLFDFWSPRLLRWFEG